MPPVHNKNTKSRQGKKKSSAHGATKRQAAKRPARKARGARMSPVGPSPTRSSARGGALGLGSGSSGATTRRGQVIAEDEYIGEVNGSTGFVTTGYSVNPGQSGTFPWGSKIAALYEEYDFEMLEFYYKREVSEFATNGQAGKVVLSFDYDASDVAPTSKQQVEDTVPHMDGMPCTPVISLRIDAARMRKNPAKYVRPGAQPANTDIKTYDCGTLYVSTQGTTNANTIGELRVRYRVRLSEPVLEPSAGVAGVVHFSGTTPTTANNFATAALQVGGSPALTSITAAADVITFPAGIAGNYLLVMTLSGTSASAFSLGAGAGATGVNLLTSVNTRDNSPQLLSLASTNSSVAVSVETLTIAATGGVVNVTPSTIVAGTGMDLFIVGLPAALTVAVSAQDQIARLTSSMREAEASSSSDLAELRTQLVQLTKQFRGLRTTSPEVSDIEDLCSPSVKKGQVPPFPAMSSSLVALVGDYVVRKSSSNK